MRKTNETFLKEVYNLVQDEYTFKEEYIGAHKQLLVKHNKCGHEYKVKPTNFLSGNRCPLCAKNFKNHELFLKEVKTLVKDEYKVLDEYVTKRHKLLFKHNHCGTYFKQYPETFLIGRMCPKCGLERRSKENHYKYNPNLTEEDRQRRDMLNGEVKKWRIKIFEKDNYKCQICSGGGKLNAHHILSWDVHVEERFNIDNGVTLCEKCHKKFHGIYGYGNNNLEQYTQFLKSQ